MVSLAKDMHILKTVNVTLISRKSFAGVIQLGILRSFWTTHVGLESNDKGPHKRQKRKPFIDRRKFG